MPIPEPGPPPDVNIPAEVYSALAPFRKTLEEILTTQSQILLDLENQAKNASFTAQKWQRKKWARDLKTTFPNRDSELEAKEKEDQETQIKAQPWVQEKKTVEDKTRGGINEEIEDDQEEWQEDGQDDKGQREDMDDDSDDDDTGGENDSDYVE
ncbi:hypothetical protein AOQ84DRAFT_386076 [Glonium stellatum]|uniref:Uncharacterized protein n=1 Tax=Glonium stellatum TaxID=574774 RepID=A0A8E2F8Q6_9PEZI|nr:hypothetical protein AOQ84DRAFT_386076 [Glonium stellatum]